MTRPSVNPATARIVAARQAEAQKRRAHGSYLRDNELLEVAQATVEICVELMTDGPSRAHHPPLTPYGLREHRHKIAGEILEAFRGAEKEGL